MSLPIIEAVHTKEKQIPGAVRPVVSEIVPIVRNNYFDLTGRMRSRSFFYKETTDNPVAGRTLLQRTALLYFSIGFASPVKAKLMESEIASWFALREQLATGVMLRRPLWNIEEAADADLRRLRSALIQGNRIDARQAAINLQRDAQQILDACATDELFEASLAR